MSTTTLILAFYIPLFLFTMVYVVVNSFHFIRFRLPGDLSWLLLAIYLLTIIGILVVSVSFAVIDYAS